MSTTGILEGEEETPRRILVVDDDRDFADSLCDLLVLEGYEAEPAYDVQDAIEGASRGSAQIALVDVRLDDQNGIDLISKFNELDIKTVCWLGPLVAERLDHVQAHGVGGGEGQDAWDCVTMKLLRED